MRSTGASRRPSGRRWSDRWNRWKSWRRFDSPHTQKCRPGRRRSTPRRCRHRTANRRRRQSTRRWPHRWPTPSRCRRRSRSRTGSCRRDRFAEPRVDFPPRPGNRPVWRCRSLSRTRIRYWSPSWRHTDNGRSDPRKGPPDRSPSRWKSRSPSEPRSRR